MGTTGRPLVYHATTVHAAAWGSLEAVRYMVKELGAGVNQIDENGDTALHAAVQSKRLDVMRCLVKELGADVNLGGAQEATQTPLGMAARIRRVEVVKCRIKELRAHVNHAQHEWMHTSLHRSRGRTFPRGEMFQGARCRRQPSRA